MLLPHLWAVKYSEDQCFAVLRPIITALQNFETFLKRPASERKIICNHTTVTCDTLKYVSINNHDINHFSSSRRYHYFLIHPIPHLSGHFALGTPLISRRFQNKELIAHSFSLKNTHLTYERHKFYHFYFTKSFIKYILKPFFCLHLSQYKNKMLCGEYTHRLTNRDDATTFD